MLAIISAVLFFIAFLINAAEISTNDTFTSTNLMLLGLTVLALHVAGIGSGWSVRGHAALSAPGANRPVLADSRPHKGRWKA